MKPNMTQLVTGLAAAVVVAGSLALGVSKNQPAVPPEAQQAALSANKGYDPSAPNQPVLNASALPQTANKEASSFGSVKQLTDRMLAISDEAAKSKNVDVKKNKHALAKVFSEQRKSEALKLMKENPLLFLSVAVKKAARAKLPAEVQQDVEEEVTVQGVLEVLHIDDFAKPENSRYDYFLKSGNTKYEFYSAQPIFLRSGAEVQVQAFRLENVLAFGGNPNKNGNNFQIKKDAPPPEAIGDQKTLVILVKPSNSFPEPFSTAQARDLIFNGNFQNFMREQSYNQISFSGDVIGWVTIPESAGQWCWFPFEQLVQIASQYNRQVPK